MKLRFTPRTVADLEAIADGLTPKSPRVAGRVRAAILKTLENLAIFPRMGRRQTTVGVRKIGVRKYPYLIFYAIDEQAQEIAILTIRHAARRPEFKDL